MLSICIPVYNQDIQLLVNELISQASECIIPVEIILIDDASVAFKKENQVFIHQLTYQNLKHIELEKNIGRSKIRNLFLDHTQYSYLLYLDCDGLIPSSDFLKLYIDELKKNPTVVCGGRIYPTECPSDKQLLRWKYGTKSESKTAVERKKNPYASFMTNNFIVRKDLIESIKFDERLSDYGHEDTLFGYLLKKNQLAITHIENPVLNNDIEENEVFLEKTEHGITNLRKIIAYSDNDSELTNDISLYRFYKNTKRFNTLFLLFFRVLKKFIRKQLINGKGSLLLFNTYKLGIFSEWMKSYSFTKHT